jgi:hypothetical protein
MELLCLGTIIGGLVLGALLGLVILFATRGTQPSPRTNSSYSGESHDSAHSGYNPRTGEWEDSNGTPYGAIDDLFMDTDGDGD